MFNMYVLSIYVRTYIDAICNADLQSLVFWDGGDGGYNSLPPINFIDFIDMSGLIFI